MALLSLNSPLVSKLNPTVFTTANIAHLTTEGFTLSGEQYRYEKTYTVNKITYVCDTYEIRFDVQLAGGGDILHSFVVNWPTALVAWPTNPFETAYNTLVNEAIAWQK